MQGSKIDITRLTLGQQEAAMPGTLLLRDRAGTVGPHLALGPIGPRQFPGVLKFDRFAVDFAVSTNHDWLAPTSWRLVVDPASAISPLGTAPVPGQAFMSEKGPGLVGLWESNLVSVFLVGGYSHDLGMTGYCGFTSWQIVSDDFEGDVPAVLFDRTAG